MKRILLVATALTLSGCNWLGSNHGHQYHNHYGYNGHHAPVQSHDGHHRVNNTTSLEFGIGAEEFTGGNISPRAVDVGGNGVISKLEYKDAYDTAWRATGGSNVAGNYSDYKSYGAEVGFREYLNNDDGRTKLRPYVGATAGVAYLESIDLEGVNGAAGLTDIEIYDSEWVPTASAVLGVEMPVSQRFSMGVESGLRYEGKRESGVTAVLGWEIRSCHERSPFKPLV